jgi:hypothetical protein
MNRKRTSDITFESASSEECAKRFMDDPDHHAIMARRNWLVGLALAGMASATACGSDDGHSPTEAGADQSTPRTSDKADTASAEVAVIDLSGRADGGWGDALDAEIDTPTCQGCQGGMCQGCT